MNYHFTTMDKYQRKHLARWEQKKAKDQRKFEEELKRHSYKNALKEIEQTVVDYVPPPDEVFATARRTPVDVFFEDEQFHFIMNIFHNDEIPFLYPLIYERVWRLTISDEEKQIEIERGKRMKQNQEVRKVARDIARHRYRANTIREELITKTNRLRAIQNCRAIKEELMANVWHPRRVEKFLETYGWEAYDNLLGVE